MQFSDLKSSWTRFAESSRGRGTLRAVETVFALGVVGYLVYELRDVSWEDLAEALPTHPVFYLLFLLLYFLLPAAEIVLYRITWTFDVWKSIPAFIKKRIYNKDVLQYSGEVYFYTWARNRVGLSDREIARGIRDQNIVSSAASTTVAVLLLIVFLYAGQINVAAWMGQQATAYLAAGVVVTLLMVLLGIRLRRYLFSMAWRTAFLIFAIHVVRLVIGQGMQIGMWAVAMPEVSLRVWFTYAAVSIVVSRIPFIPNRDLIFLGIGVSLSEVVQISEVGVLGMLGAITVLGKVFNVVFFAVLSVFERKPPRAVLPDEALDAAEPLPLAEPEEVP